LLKKKHADNINVARNSIPGGVQILVQGRFSDRGGTNEAIEIRATKSGDAFQGLHNNQCDIGLSSRAIKPSEESDLADLGPMTSFACEHVMGVDGVAIIVNKRNPILELSKTQLVRIFGKGGTTTWKDFEPNFEYDIKISVEGSWKHTACGHSPAIRYKS
jgi:phosphate transport system substrate-binding protein